MRLTKENNSNIYNTIIEQTLKGKEEILENLYKIRNIKVKYNNKELTVPRKTVKIIRTNK